MTFQIQSMYFFIKINVILIITQLWGLMLSNVVGIGMWFRTYLNGKVVLSFLYYLGDGAFNRWQYDIYIVQDATSDNKMLSTSSELNFEVSNLQSDTKYEVKVRGRSNAGHGPWSRVFHGRTLKQGTVKFHSKSDSFYSQFRSKPESFYTEIPFILFF